MKRFYTIIQLGAKQSVTPDGFLLCSDVAIARTGEMLYGPGETDIEPGDDGIAYISRTAKEVFRPETIASFNGKPVTNGHPDVGVNPTNWNGLAMGVVMNCRQGQGAEDDLLLADLLITNAEAIETVREGKREVSCGYDCDYFETGKGRGEQRNIVGNHVALVDTGRCGSRCSIRDHATVRVARPRRQGDFMKKQWNAVALAIREAFKTKDERALETALAEVPAQDENGVHIHNHMAGENSEGRSKFTDEALEAKFADYDSKHKTHDAELAELKSKMAPIQNVTDEEKEIEGQLQEEAPAGTGDKAVMAKDSSYLEDSYTSTKAGAEILCPGLHTATFDKARDPKATFKDVCGLRRKAITGGMAKDNAVATMAAEVNGGRALQPADVDKMPCARVRDMFNSLVALKKLANNSAVSSVSAVVGAGGGTGVQGKVKNPADLNARLRKHYGQE